MNNQVIKDPGHGSARFAVEERAIDQFRRTPPYVGLCLEFFNYQLNGALGTPAPKLTIGTMVISRPLQHGGTLMEASGEVFPKGNESAIVGEVREMTHWFMAPGCSKYSRRSAKSERPMPGQKAPRLITWPFSGVRSAEASFSTQPIFSRRQNECEP